MYSHSQRGICSVAPLTLPSRELSGACVYLPLFVLRSPRPRRENTSREGVGRGGPESRGALRTSSSEPEPAAATGTLSCPPKKSERSGCWQLLCHIQWRVRSFWGFAQWCSGAPNIESQGAGELWQKNTWRRRPLLSHQQQGLDITHNICLDLSKQTMLKIDAGGQTSLSL